VTFFFNGHASDIFTYAKNVNLSQIKLFRTDFRKSEADFKLNMPVLLIFESYLYVTFFFNGHASDTFSYAKNVNLSHIKLFRTDFRKPEADFT